MTPREMIRKVSSHGCRDHVEDLLLGCGQPAGESGYNMARVVSVLAGQAD